MQYVGEGSMITVCCYCHRIKVNDEWVVVPINWSADRISHGVCPDCLVVHYPDSKIAKKIKRREK